VTEWDECLKVATKRLMTLSLTDSKINIWHRYTGQLLERLEGHGAGCVNAVAWNTALPSMFASAGDDCKVRMYVLSSAITLAPLCSSWHLSLHLPPPSARGI